MSNENKKLTRETFFALNKANPEPKKSETKLLRLFLLYGLFKTRRRPLLITHHTATTTIIAM